MADELPVCAVFELTPGTVMGAGRVGQVSGARSIQRSSTNVSPKSQSNTTGAMTEDQGQSPS
jgi:hypothetical protein